MTEFITTAMLEANMAPERFMYEHEIPGKNGNDPTIIQAYRLELCRNVIIQIPARAQVSDRKIDGPPGEYQHVIMPGQVSAHFREGLIVVPKQVTRGDVTIFFKAWWPKGSRERGCGSSGQIVYCNYAICTNMEPASDVDAKATHKLVFVNTGGTVTRRQDNIISPTVFAHRSPQRDHHLILEEINPSSDLERATAGGEPAQSGPAARRTVSIKTARGPARRRTSTDERVSA